MRQVRCPPVVISTDGSLFLSVGLCLVCVEVFVLLWPPENVWLTARIRCIKVMVVRLGRGGLRGDRSGERERVSSPIYESRCHFVGGWRPIVSVWCAHRAKSRKRMYRDNLQQHQQQGYRMTVMDNASDSDSNTDSKQILSFNMFRV